MSIGISEKDFAKWLEELLEIYGYKWVHFRPARVRRGGKEIYETPYTGHKGFVDYVIAHEEKKRLLFVELKSEEGRVSPEQERWIEVLRECVRQITYTPIEIAKKRIAGQITLVPSFEVYIWRPSDRDKIEEILR